MIYLIAIPLFLQIKELLIKEKSTYISDKKEFRKELEENIIGRSFNQKHIYMTEKITNLELQIKKFLKENENCKRCKQIFDDIQDLKKDLEILKFKDFLDAYSLSKICKIVHEIDLLYHPLKFNYFAALDCDLKELPVIQGILKQIKNDNPGFFQ